MKMGVEAKVRRGSLDDGDRASLASGATATIPFSHRIGKEVEHMAEMAGIESEWVTQRVRKGQYPLPDRHLFGQNMVDKVRRTLVHAPSHAAWAKASALATEGNQVTLVAGIAVHLRESVRENAAGQILT
jgi:hypothetical protein